MEMRRPAIVIAVLAAVCWSMLGCTRTKVHMLDGARCSSSDESTGGAKLP